MEYSIKSINFYLINLIHFCYALIYSNLTYCIEAWGSVSVVYFKKNCLLRKKNILIFRCNIIDCRDGLI